MTDPFDVLRLPDHPAGARPGVRGAPARASSPAPSPRATTEEQT